METVTKKRKKARPRRSFSPEFKAEIVAACQRGDRSIGQVAKDFDLVETAVRRWIADADPNKVEAALGDDERDELERLRKENRQLREDVGILKRATAFFAKETR